MLPTCRPEEASHESEPTCFNTAAWVLTYASYVSTCSRKNYFIGIIACGMTLNDHQVQHNRGLSQKNAGIIELGTNDGILAHNKLLTQIVEELTKKNVQTSATAQRNSRSSEQTSTGRIL